MSKRIDLTGQKFGRLKVISYEGKTDRGRPLWKCECECGNIAIVRSDRLKNGDTKSCGCEQIRKIKEMSTIHGNSDKRLYRIWRGMINRTENKKVKAYYRYGGRGISVCKEWKENYDSFEKWSLENGYKDNLTIDRKNNDGDYSPENCRWVEWDVQGSNKSNVKKYRYNGELKTIPQLAEIANLKPATLRTRIRKGMEISEAVEMPNMQGSNKSNTKRYRYNGELKTISQLAEIANLKPETLRARIKKGMEISEAIETPVTRKNLEGKRRKK